MYVFPGIPARWNDKTIVNFDDFVTRIKTNKFHDDKVLTLKEWSGEEIIERLQGRLGLVWKWAFEIEHFSASI